MIQNTYMKRHSSCQRRHFATPGRAIHRQGFQLRQTCLAVTEEAALRVVYASLHKGQQGASHNALCWQTQHVAEVPQTALANSQYQVVHRYRCRCSVVLTGDGMQTAAVRTVDHVHHRSCEGPGLTRVCERYTRKYVTASTSSHGTGGGRSTGGSVSRTPHVRRPCGDGHPPHPPRRPVAGCQGTQSVARCRWPRCRHTPCPEPPRPLASWPFSQPCRLACQVVIVAYDRRRTIEPCVL